MTRRYRDPELDHDQAIEEWERKVEADETAMLRRDRLADHAPAPIDYAALDVLHARTEAMWEMRSRISQCAGPRRLSGDFHGSLA